MGPFIVSTSLCVNPEEVSGAISLLALTNQPKTNRRKLPKILDFFGSDEVQIISRMKNESGLVYQ